jgi:GNAT superfamily N-acetyltransferase
MAVFSYAACMKGMDPGLSEVSVVPRDEWAKALVLVFDWEHEAQRQHRVSACLQASDSDGLNFQHLLEIRRGEERVAAAWGQVAPGRVVNVWPPSLVPGEPANTADLLQTGLDRRLESLGVACAQSLLPVQASAASACLLRHGYSLVAELLFLACHTPQPPFQQPATDLVFEPYRLDQRCRLAQLIDETYIKTRDIPALNGLRSTDDVIDGYQCTGTFSPNLWFFVRAENRDIGCLLVTDHPDAGQFELIYMGLIPSARGQGWGMQLARQAQWLAWHAGRDAILLGVDAANHPARVTYERCGFAEVDRRLVFCRACG